MLEKGGAVPGSVAIERPEITWRQSQSPVVASVREVCAPTVSRCTIPV
mgnify:FL=1